MQLTILGGANEIGANSYYLNLGGAGILLDAGLHPKKDGADALPLFSAVQGEVDEILISHAHLDHVGSLPVALKHFPRSRVYMSGPTSLLAVRMMRNAVAVSRHHAQGHKPPLYTEDNVEWVEQVLRIEEIGHSFTLQNVIGERPKITFYNAGHLLGAVGILVEYQGQRFFYSGDTCATGQYICGPARYPKGPVDTLLMESTHGGDTELDLERDQKAFKQSITELGQFISTVAARGGSVLIPVFALGRAQEVLSILYTLTQRRAIPPLPIYVSGLAHAVCRIYDAIRMDSERLHPDLRLEDVSYRLLDPERWADPSLIGSPCILAVTSGMMHEGTSSNLLASRILPDAKHGIAFVGFLDSESPGYAVANTPPGEMVTLGGNAGRVRVRCSIGSFNITAHSRASQLVQTVKDLNPKHVVLVHGDSESVQSMSRHLSPLVPRLSIANLGATIDL
jgi:Cft2 family RNA processing exonuclease